MVHQTVPNNGVRIIPAFIVRLQDTVLVQLVHIFCVEAVQPI